MKVKIGDYVWFDVFDSDNNCYKVTRILVSKDNFVAMSNYGQTLEDIYRIYHTRIRWNQLRLHTINTPSILQQCRDTLAALHNIVVIV